MESGGWLFILLDIEEEALKTVGFLQVTLFLVGMLIYVHIHIEIMDVS